MNFQIIEVYRNVIMVCDNNHHQDIIISLSHILEVNTIRSGVNYRSVLSVDE